MRLAEVPSRLAEVPARLSEVAERHQLPERISADFTEGVRKHERSGRSCPQGRRKPLTTSPANTRGHR